LKIACIGYRQWALNIYRQINSDFSEHLFLMQLSKDDFSLDEVARFSPDLVLFYGWSDIIAPEVISEYNCLMLHPSPLPKYRGGSPIQNQIINGEVDSAVSIFLMDDGIDTGPIVRQKYLSLRGEIPDIFRRLEIIGYELTADIIQVGLNPVAQSGDDATYFSRRSPDQSEITLKELEEESAEYLYNKIRMLQDPYPNPFIRTRDGKRLLIKKAEIG
jgi:methionyl-tRNA formyltransferase